MQGSADWVGPERGRRPWAYEGLSDKNYYVNFTTGVEIDSTGGLGEVDIK